VRSFLGHSNETRPAVNTHRQEGVHLERFPCKQSAHARPRTPLNPSFATMVTHDQSRKRVGPPPARKAFSSKPANRMADR
jgi:hypothetical protein